MSANRKVVLIVLLGVGAAVASFFLSRYFLEKDRRLQQALSQIQMAISHVEQIRLMGKTYAHYAEPSDWQRISSLLASVHRELETATEAAPQWQAIVATLNRRLGDYGQVLTRLKAPALSLKEEKAALQAIGLSFAAAVEAQIVRPYREEESLAIYDGLLMDVSERRNLERALRLTQFSFDRASVGIFRIGSDGRITDVNAQACTNLGYTREELLTKHILDIDATHSHERWQQHRALTRAAGSRVIETAHRRKDGSTYPVEVLVNYLEFENEFFTISFVKDISERVQAAEETQRLQQALQQAQKMEAIGTLAGGIAHDFNNILSAVFGYTQLAMLDASGQPHLEKHLQQILAAATRAGDLVRQILTFSRQGEQELKPLKIAPLVKEALKMLRASLPATIDIVQEVSTDTDCVVADPTHIHQVVMNLCTNAAQAMAPEGGQLRITLSQGPSTDVDRRHCHGLDAGPYVRLTVNDTGPGIAAEIMEKMFDPYFTTKARGKGTGLGLAVVHGLVQSSGGGVYAESPPGQGAAFTVLLPVAAADPMPERDSATRLPKGTEHILLVDDEPVLVDVGRQILSHLGYRVSTAHSGAEALERFRAAPGGIDLVVTDMTMPKMTGDRLARELRSIRPDLPIIISTGYSTPLAEEDMTAAGIRAIIHKPVAADTLAGTVRRVLDTVPAKGNGAP